jgi:hypothetical protein
MEWCENKTRRVDPDNYLNDLLAVAIAGLLASRFLE